MERQRVADLLESQSQELTFQDILANIGVYALNNYFFLVNERLMCEEKKGKKIISSALRKNEKVRDKEGRRAFKTDSILLVSGPQVMSNINIMKKKRNWSFRAEFKSQTAEE